MIALFEALAQSLINIFSYTFLEIYSIVFSGLDIGLRSKTILVQSTDPLMVAFERQPGVNQIKRGPAAVTSCE